MLTLDHIVLATADLDTGTAWVADRLGAPPAGGGKHPAFGTHNRLWRLDGSYLELIATDPDAPPPRRPRWFALDNHDQKRRIADRPRLVAWVARSDDLDADIARSPLPTGPAERFTRDALFWDLTVAPGGVPHWQGAFPALIRWPAEVMPPSESLPDQHLRLTAFAATGPEGLRRDLSLIGADQILKVETLPGPVALRASVRRADGATVILD